MNSVIKIVIFFIMTSAPILSQTCPSDTPSSNFQTPYFSKEYKPSQSLQLYIGPEIYHVERKRSGGARQDGYLYGFRAGYDRIKRYKFYLGFDVLYASGILEGKGASGNTLKSNFSDTSLEGRFGYTLKSKICYKPSITPFIGLGYFVEENNFSRPKNTPIHFRTSFLYATVGFLSQISLNERLDLGFNFKAKYPYEATCKVSNDPREDDSKQVVGEKFQYRAELPITYKFCSISNHLRLSVVPFYEIRQYGYHPNYPCDFLETRLNICGIQFKVMYCL